jgi:hypothetical protein
VFYHTIVSSTVSKLYSTLRSQQFEQPAQLSVDNKSSSFTGMVRSTVESEVGSVYLQTVTCVMRLKRRRLALSLH